MASTYSCIQPAIQKIVSSYHFSAQHLLFKPSPAEYTEINLTWRGADHQGNYAGVGNSMNRSAEAGEIRYVRT